MAADTTDRVPGWWQYAEDEWSVFHGALRWAMDVRGGALPSPLGRTLTVGRTAVALDRLGAELRRLPTARWPAATARYLADHDDRERQRAASAAAADLAAVRPRLLARNAVPDDLPITVEVAGLDLVATLALVEDSGERWVGADDIAAWGRPAKDVWDQAVANLRLDRVEFMRAGALSIAHDNGRPVAAHVLRLAELHAEPAPDGFIVGVACPAFVTFTPIVGTAWLDALGDLPEILRRQYTGEFGGLSPHMYWCLDGRFEQIRLEISGGKATIGASEQFKAVFDRVLRAARGR